MTDLRRRAPVPAETWTPREAVVSRDTLKAEVAAWEKRLRVEPREVHVRPMRQKWGSCSTGGRVTFNAELLSESAAFRKRVIVEELLHLKVPNHGRLFRALLKAHLGRDVDAQPRRRSADVAVGPAPPSARPSVGPARSGNQGALWHGSRSGE